MHFLIKLGVTALAISLISEVAKRSTFAAGILAALPTVSILSIIWIYFDSKDPVQVATFSKTVFWGVLPSLLFFILLPFLLHKQMGFWWALLVSSAAMAMGFFVYTLIVKKYGIEL